MPWRSMRDWRYNATNLDPSSKWRWEASFMQWALYSWRKRPWYQVNRRLGKPYSLSGCYGVAYQGFRGGGELWELNQGQQGGGRDLTWHLYLLPGLPLGSPAGLYCVCRLWAVLKPRPHPAAPPQPSKVLSVLSVPSNCSSLSVTV
jgi:hypothetical protein